MKKLSAGNQRQYKKGDDSMTQAALKIDQEQEIKERAIDLYAQGKAIAITDEESYKRAGEFLIQLKNMRKVITDYFKPMKDAAYRAHREITAKEKAETDKIDGADGLVRMHIKGYLCEVEKKRREEQARLEEEARKKSAIEQERLLKRAERAEGRGDGETASELIERAAESVPEPVFAIPEIDKTVKIGDAGSITTKKDIEINIINLSDLIAGVASGKIPETVIQIKESILKSWIKSAGKRGSEVPGVLIKEVQNISVR